MYGLHQEQSGKVVQQDYGWVGSWGRLLVVWQRAVLLKKSDLACTSIVRSEHSDSLTPTSVNNFTF